MAQHREGELGLAAARAFYSDLGLVLPDRPCLDSVAVALSRRGCEPRRIGPAQRRSACPCCGEPDTLGIGYGFGGLRIAARCGCPRAAILPALGVEEGR
jgi:hypothetical protein